MARSHTGERKVGDLVMFVSGFFQCFHEDAEVFGSAVGVDRRDFMVLDEMIQRSAGLYGEGVAGEVRDVQFDRLADISFPALIGECGPSVYQVD